MTALIAWGGPALIASAVLILLVLVERGPVRNRLGPQFAYALWALPALRLVLPPLPDTVVAAGAPAGMSVLFSGPRGALGLGQAVQASPIGDIVFAAWLVGALGLFAVYATRHFVFCHRLRIGAVALGEIDGVRVLATDVEGPLAFGVANRVIVVPRTFAQAYRPAERDLALAHERTHHARGDPLANWASLVVLAVHWWNPVAWLAIRAFRDDQEFAADAAVIRGKPPAVVALYGEVLAKAAGIGALPACNLNARSNLKGRLMMLTQMPKSRARRALGGAVLAALAATAAPAASGGQVVTIGVKPDGKGSYALIVGGKSVARGASLPGGKTLPADFDAAGGCSLKPAAKPVAMVIKGENGTMTYTVMCASAARTPVRASLSEGLASLKTMRASVATQRTAAFPEAEQIHALGAIDRSIREVEASLATR